MQERWAEKNNLKFNRGKYGVLHLGRSNVRHQHRLGADLLENSSVEKDLGVLVNNKLFTSQQCVLAAGEIASGILSGLLSTRETWKPGVKTTKVVKGLEHLY
ncbi:hypothetical protein BTVI_07374 [Pitangus sulphuratus]|nr:hypothetical protein BTVI_07374 [Pitangus sulphuratus]